MKKERFRITLDIVGYKVPVWIEKGNEQEEELYRNASKQISDLLTRYSISEGNSGLTGEANDVSLLIKVAIHLSKRKLELEKLNDTKPYSDKICELSALLDSEFAKEKGE